jgi:hypothetical protein
MKKIKLTGKYGSGKFVLVDDEDFEVLNKFKWYLAGKYPVKSIGKRPNRKKISIHRLIMNPPKNMMVDHKDNNGLNNQRSNLRICTNAQNIMNANKFKRKCSSKYKGVSKLNPWRASIGNKTLGNFKTEIEAAKAYDIAAKELYKEFARLNFID